MSTELQWTLYLKFEANDFNFKLVESVNVGHLMYKYIHNIVHYILRLASQ